jgi:voltage-gated potassium channel
MSPFRVGKNHKAQVIIAVVYIVVWLVFGLLYQWRANSTNGRAFTFQEDLKVSSQVQEFKKRKDLRVDDKIIKNLIPTCSWDFVVEGKTAMGKLVPATRNIGWDWAIYYSKRFESARITHFAVKITPNTVEAPYKEDGVWRRGPLYELDILLFLGDSSDKTNKPVATYPILAIRHPKSISEHFEEEVKYEIRGLPDILSQSTHFLDDSFATLKEIVDGHYEYPLLDFLYFSAITITTVGYGDILPHDSIVRVLVMAESLLGVVILGIFLTTLGNFRKEQ